MPGLATYVHVRDTGGAVHIFGPGDDVPEWAAALITNPAAWADGAGPSSVSRLTELPPKPPVKRAAPRKKAAPNGDAVQR